MPCGCPAGSQPSFTVAAASGNTAIAGNLAVNTNKFTVNGGNGDTVVAGTFQAIGGPSTFASRIDATGGLNGRIGQTTDGAAPAAGTFTALTATSGLQVAGDLNQGGGKVGFFGAPAVIKQAALSSDSSGQGTVQVCTDNGSPCTKATVANGATATEVNAVTWIADGKQIASGGADYLIRLWYVDVAKRELAALKEITWSKKISPAS